MYILPYIQIHKKSGVQQFWLFLERNGTHLIEIDTLEPASAIEYATEFLETNELLAAAKPFCIGNIVYCPIDSTTPSLSNFYTWKETPSGTIPPREVWRAFIWMSSNESSDPWGVNHLMGSTLVSDTKDGHTVYSILTPLVVIP